MSMAQYVRAPPPDGAIPSQWRRDVHTSHAAMTTTGGLLWNCSRRLIDYMEAMAHELQLARKGLRVLELGSGVGYVGMVLAANLPDMALMLCTEQADGGALDWLNRNVALNGHLNLSALRTCVCDWSEFAGGQATTSTNEAPAQSPSAQSAQSDAGAVASDALTAPGQGRAVDGARCCTEICSQDKDDVVRSTCWDFILGSDLIYSEAGCRLLPKALSALASPRTQVLYAHTKRRFENLDIDFFESLRSHGFSCEEVHEPWVPSPPQSPPPFEALFPDMRIAVYRISRSFEGT